MRDARGMEIKGDSPIITAERQEHEEVKHMVWHQGELNLAITGSTTLVKLCNLPVLGFLICKMGTYEYLAHGAVVKVVVVRGSAQSGCSKVLQG